MSMTKKKPGGRPKNQTTARTTTCYPDPWVVRPLGSLSPQQATQAVECWAFVLTQATLDNEQLLTPDEWEALYQVIPMSQTGMIRGMDPRMSDPSLILVNLVRSARLEDKELAASLERKVAKVDYIHAWAAVWAVQYTKKHLGPEREYWWMLAARPAPPLEE